MLSVERSVFSFILLMVASLSKILLVNSSTVSFIDWNFSPKAMVFSLNSSRDPRPESTASCCCSMAAPTACMVSEVRLAPSFISFNRFRSSAEELLIPSAVSDTPFTTSRSRHIMLLKSCERVPISSLLVTSISREISPSATVFASLYIFFNIREPTNVASAIPITAAIRAPTAKPGSIPRTVFLIRLLSMAIPTYQCILGISA